LIDFEVDWLMIEIKDSYFIWSAYQTCYSCTWW